MALSGVAGTVFGRWKAPVTWIILLPVVLMTGCPGSVEQTATPMAAHPRVGSSVHEEILTVRLSSVRINHINPDFPGLDVNQAQVIAIFSDGHQLREHNCHPEPVEVCEGQYIDDLDGAGFFVDLQKTDIDTIYVWFVVVDNDEFSQAGDVAQHLAGSFSSFLLEEGVDLLVPGLGKGASILYDYMYDQAFDYLQKEDVLGDIALAIPVPDENLSASERITTPNDAITLEYVATHILHQHPVGARGAGSLDEDSLTQCTEQALPTQLSVGQLAVVSVQEGSTLFLKEEPEKDMPGIRYEPGNVVRILDGPSCDGSKMYWLVEGVQGQEGWMAESEYVDAIGRGVYMLSPMPLSPGSSGSIDRDIIASYNRMTIRPSCSLVNSF